MTQHLRIILCVTNDLLADQRLHKMCTTLHGAGHTITLVGRKRKHSTTLEPRAYATVRLKVLWEKGALFYASYNLRLWWWLMWQRADVFTANDLDTLPAVSLAAWLRRKRLVFDAHELFTDVPELRHRHRTRAVWRWLESRFLPPVQRCITVNDELARVYRERYGKQFAVVWNYPNRQPAPPEHWKHNREEPEQKVLLYQGVLNEGRGLELMLNTLPLLPPNYRLWVVGGGPLEQHLHEQARRLNIYERVRFFGWVPFQQVAAITAQATVGLSLEDPAAGQNSLLSSPNKLFDYLQARLPVVVSNIPIAERIVHHYAVGVVVPERTPSALAAAVRTLIEEQEHYTACVRNTEHAAAELCWEHQVPALLAVYTW